LVLIGAAIRRTWEGSRGATGYHSRPATASPHTILLLLPHRRQAQEDLRLANEELETHVAERTKELAKANCILRNEVAERECAEAKFHNLLKSAPDAIITIDG
jgi:PAS domain S-box-containing protein